MNSLVAICKSLGYAHLSEAAANVSLSQCMDTFAASGKVALLAELASALPGAKLPERQKIAIAVSKEKRVPPPPEPIEGPPRVLFLHGYGTCPEVMQRSVAGLHRALPGCEMELLRGFETINQDDQATMRAFQDPGMNGLERLAAWSASTGTTLHCWGGVRDAQGYERAEKRRNYNSFLKDGRTLDYAWDGGQMTRAVAKLLDHVNNDPKGFDMLVGFSQGGELIFLLAARAHMFIHSKRRPYRFAIFGAEIPLCLCHEPSLSFARASAAPTKPPNAIACFAVMGDEDAGNRDGFAEGVAQCSELGLCIEGQTWSGGHVMPPAEDSCYERMVEHLFTRTRGGEEHRVHDDDVDDDDDLAALGF